MAIRRAIVVDYGIPTPLFANRHHGSKVKYIKHAVAILDDIGVKFKFVIETT